MTCKHCCGADQLFDLKRALKELRKYDKKGPRKTTGKLAEMMFANLPINKSLLDIGGGIGALQWAFLEKGGSKTIDIDASQSYLMIAEKYASENKFNDKVSFIHGDFIDKTKEISSCDYVTLDKVICCYPDYKKLLTEALKKCHSIIGLTYPYGGFISKLIMQFGKLYFYLKKNPFRTYIHDPKEVEKLILNQDFKIITKTTSFPWHVQVYERNR